MSARETATRELLYFIDQFSPGSDNRDIYESRLNAMTNDEFATFMGDLESGKETLALFIANLTKHRLSIKTNLAIAEELGHDFFQHLWLTDAATGQVRKTPIKHMVVDLPLRRQVQMLVKKMSVPDDNHMVDARSGQPPSNSRVGRVSYPELQINAAKGLDNMVLELIKYRGGNTEAFNAMNRDILETGEASLKAIDQKTKGSVKSTQTLSIFLKAMHLDNNLE